ncbi:MAG TPA: AI-2E family transporter [Gammaproteobacteria bacterium]|nr:AI-2E family transporter [Gammaproteobacteria bacterium]
MITDAQKWLIFGGIIVTGWLLYLLSPVLTPFLIAMLLAYLADPLVDRLEKLKISRTIAVVIVFAFMFTVALLLLLILVPMTERQLAGLIRIFPEFINWLQNSLIPGLASTFGVEIGTINLESVKKTAMANWQDIGGILGRVLSRFSESGQFFFTLIVYLLLIPVVTFYLLRDWDDLVARAHDLIPRRHAGLVGKLAGECDSVLAEFLRGQLLVMLGLGIIYTIGLWLAGLEFAFLIGMLAGLVSFVPYLGAIVGILAAGIAAMMQFGDVLHLVYVALVFGIGQSIEGMILSPLLVGDRIGLHPVAVIFAVMAGGQLFGFFGVLLALPVAAVIVVLLRHMKTEYQKSTLYQS